MATAQPAAAQPQSRKVRLTLEQERARHSWEKAGEARAKLGKGYKDYVNDAKGLPALIMNSGLMQVMAFCHDKGGRHETLAQHLREWLHKQCGTPSGFEEFMQHLMNCEPSRFQLITTEAFAWLRWLRQMASARVG